jgi:nitrous oxidase accessory protein NosD
LATTIAGASAGQTIQLAAGDYGALTIANRKFAAPGLTIEPQPGAKANFSAMVFVGSEGVTVKDVELTVDAVNYGVAASGSSNIVLSGLKIHGDPDAGKSAMMLRNVHDITVQDCDIRSIGFGINFLDSDRLHILRNSFTDLQVDAIRGESSHVEVIGNHATSFHPKTGDHPDFIQFWGNKAGPSTGTVVKDNVYVRGSGAVVQGIFLAASKDVVVSGNALLGTMYNGISLSQVETALIENNFVQGYADMGTRIITRGQSSDVTIRNNVSEAIVTVNDGGVAPPRYKVEHNQSIAAAKVGDDRAFQDWLAKRKGG